MRVLALLVLLAGCTTFLEPEGAVLFEPPDAYMAWYDEVQECVGISRSYAAIEWYVVPTAWEIEAGTAVGGYDSGRIYLLEPQVELEWLVKHEMIHHLLAPSREHPRPPFGFCEVA